MIYILTGDENYLIDRNLEKIIKENKDADIVRIDGSNRDFSIKELVNMCNTIDLFSSNRIIIVKNPFFFCKKADEKELLLLTQYCKNPVYENTLIFYSDDNSFNERLKVFKDVSSNAQLIKCNKLKKYDFERYAQQLLTQRSIRLNKSVFDRILRSANNSLTIFNQNLDIIELYPEDINDEVIDKMLISSNEEDVFNLINSLTNKDISKSIHCVRKLFESNNNVNGLISLLATQLRFLYEIDFYRKNDYSTQMIMEKTNSKSSYRIEKAYESLSVLKSKEILTLLNRLSEFDYNSKVNSEVDDKLKFELFIVSLLI